MTGSGDNPRTPTHDDPRSELLSRAYRDAVDNAADEPGRSIDDAIRAAAHRAVESSPRSRKAAGLQAVFRHWRMPLALAATLLLAVGIALRVYKSGEIETVLPRAPVKGQSIRQELATEEAEKPQPQFEQKRRTNEAASAPPSHDAVRSSERRTASDEEIPGEPGIGRNKAAPSAEPADKAEDSRGAESGTSQAPQPETAERQEAHPAAKPFPGAAGAAPASPPAREPSAAPGAPAPPQTTGAPALPSLSRARTERAAEKKAVAAQTTAVQLLAQRLDGRPPEVWIEEIRTLKRAGRAAEATELLAALRKKFPNFALPDDLK